nr:hypothetical protein [Thiocapsa sp. KS1]
MERRRVDKRSAVHQRRRWIRWTSLALVHPTAGISCKGEPERQTRISSRTRFSPRRPRRGTPASVSRTAYRPWGRRRVHPCRSRQRRGW